MASALEGLAVALACFALFFGFLGLEYPEQTGGVSSLYLLTDVNVGNAADGQLLGYNQSLGFWVPIANSGAQGPQGEPGINGVNGTQGETGLTGPQGPQGEQGPIGPNGSQGIQGEQGIQGIQGVAGINGTNGATGAKGDKGDKGDTGTAGTNGTNGTNAVLNIAATSAATRTETSCETNDLLFIICKGDWTNSASAQTINLYVAGALVDTVGVKQAATADKLPFTLTNVYTCPNNNNVVILFNCTSGNLGNTKISVLHKR